ncbi:MULTISPECIES: hypothetical protein [unclassified Polaromonas]|uniref:hypothetical protein n=1 Tax=unclassified Polaromonas TaxID=2638319 RepID=UPI000BC972AB|nr:MULTISPECIES: hypothetical protein [unclassified Polaromonas]OYY34795.1 MAG: hypothetical protein B7Y60_15260 [Polaromonas sp. 35-63-35]OYZ77556.1 MAG: hypothetical protein B7Y09_16420 [Polaromonas sp. 24-63-21]OZA48461.1 MAG: hypothetical protein B7X88_18100 [Polaromonas sp. 17-63-33]HQR98169.1 hypothetical protein [Polaromonas sp.]HQS38877.1 hypothetical protein [Polaromonas sp.]
MHEQNNPVLKATVAWGGVAFSKWLESVGITSWGDFAAMLAAIYSLFLILDWLYKKWSNR